MEVVTKIKRKIIATEMLAGSMEVVGKKRHVHRNHYNLRKITIERGPLCNYVCLSRALREIRNFRVYGNLRAENKICDSWCRRTCRFLGNTRVSSEVAITK